MRLKRPLYGPDHEGGPSRGTDVKMVKRALGKVEDGLLPPRPGGYDSVFNRRTVEALDVFRRSSGQPELERRRGKPFGQEDLDWLEPYFDAYGRWRYRLYRPPAPKPKLIAPLQGWASLDQRLWDHFSQGRLLGFSDLGTYNPASRLPSGAPSDHAVFPARAYDLGISPAIGYANPKARAYFNSLIGDPDIEYVILGDKIWSRARGLHAYTSGGHQNHIHVSGRK